MANLEKEPNYKELLQTLQNNTKYLNDEGNVVSLDAEYKKKLKLLQTREVELFEIREKFELEQLKAMELTSSLKKIKDQQQIYNKIDAKKNIELEMLENKRKVEANNFPSVTETYQGKLNAIKDNDVDIGEKIRVQKVQMAELREKYQIYKQEINIWKNDKPDNDWTNIKKVTGELDKKRKDHKNDGKRCEELGTDVVKMQEVIKMLQDQQ